MTRKELLMVIGIVLLGAIAGGLYFYYQAQTRPEAAVIEPASRVVAPPAVPEEETQIRNPLPAASPAGEDASASAVTIDISDAPMFKALGQVFGAQSVMQFVVPQMLVRHLVATVDNLPRKKAPLQMWPVKQTGGKPVTSGQDDSLMLSAESYERYVPAIRVLQASDMKQVGALYVRYYPLFQKAYEDLGYPSKYFNDRLVAVIDDLLETPDVTAPIALEQPNVLYQYKDPALENLSAGQKVLLRMGPENAAIVKQKLRELRANVATGSR